MAVFGNQPKPKTLKDSKEQFNAALSILYPKLQTDEHKVNPYILQILHSRKIFAGEDDLEDPYVHLDYFNDICETFKLKGFSYDMKLKLFGQTLSSKALAWYKAFSIEFKDTWKNLSQAPLSRYYPMSKTTGARHTISYFKNRLGESISRCIYKELLSKWPHHGIPNWFVLYVFYGGLNEENKNRIGMATRGSFLDLTITEDWKKLDTMRLTWLCLMDMPYICPWFISLGAESD